MFKLFRVKVLHTKTCTLLCYYMEALKEQFTHKWSFSHYAHPNADGKVGEVLYSKHFRSVPVKQCCSIFLKCLKILKSTKKEHKTAPCSSPKVWKCWDPKEIWKDVVYILDLGQVPASTSDDVCVNTYSLEISVMISALNKRV